MGDYTKMLSILREVLYESSAYQDQQFYTSVLVVQAQEKTWVDLYLQYLIVKTLLVDKVKAKKIR